MGFILPAIMILMGASPDFFNSLGACTERLQREEGEDSRMEDVIRARIESFAQNNGGSPRIELLECHGGALACHVRLDHLSATRGEAFVRAKPVRWLGGEYSRGIGELTQELYYIKKGYHYRISDDTIAPWPSHPSNTPPTQQGQNSDKERVQ